MEMIRVDSDVPLEHQQDAPHNSIKDHHTGRGVIRDINVHFHMGLAHLVEGVQAGCNKGHHKKYHLPDQKALDPIGQSP
jgi:hypothetical protein